MTTKSKKTVEKLEKTLNKSSVVDSAEQFELLIERVKKAQKIYSTYTQEQVDKIFKAAATAADKARIPLARMAAEETGMGVLEDKIIKNHFASEYIYNKHKNAKTFEKHRIIRLFVIIISDNNTEFVNIALKIGLLSLQFRVKIRCRMKARFLTHHKRCHNQNRHAKALPCLF